VSSATQAESQQRQSAAATTPFTPSAEYARHYDPGTNVLITTWKTPSGWIVVFDALTMGPREGDDTITPHTRPPADDDADHVLVGRSSASRGRSRSSLSASRSSITGESRPIRRQDRPSPGQLPQAFSHLALIEATARIILSERVSEIS
jgi:GH15 family glucan-1,4-alpha-glucosidase